MDKIYRGLLIAICAVGILFGLQYFLPVTAQLFNVKGVSGIPGLPAMPTFAYEPTIAPLPLITLEIDATTQAGFFFITPASTLLPGVTAATTATATPTLVPGATTSIPPTATRSSSTGATPRPSATRTPTTQSSSSQVPATATQAVVQNPCDNVLYPLRKGNEWVYRLSAQGRSMDVNMVAVDADLVDVYNQTTGVASRVFVECSNGAILNFPWAVGGMLSNSAAIGEMDVQYVSGTLAPSLADFQSKNWNLSWSGSYRLSGNASVPFRGQNFELTLNDSPLTLTCRTVAFESIKTANWEAPQALKIVCTGESQATGTVNGLPVSGTVTGQSTQWFARVGLLKMQVDSANFNVLGFSLPLDLVGGVELITVNIT
jgi:hypothetical protein